MRSRTKPPAIKKTRAASRTIPRKRNKADVSNSVEKRKVETVYDRIKHLSGVLEGPGNLSTALDIERRARHKHQTPYDRIKHLSGIVNDLPPDLLTNPKYVEDFGK